MDTGLRILAVAAGISLGVTGCAEVVGAGANGPASAVRDYTSVEVDNKNWSDMVVYLVHGGSRLRLGTVTSMTRARFELPPAATTGTGEVRFLADPIGSRDAHLSQTVLVSPGQLVEWTLENHLPLSSISVW